MQWSALCSIFLTITVLTKTHCSEVSSQDIHFGQQDNNVKKNVSSLDNTENNEPDSRVNVDASLRNLPIDDGDNSSTLQNATLTDAQQSSQPKSTTPVQRHYSRLEAVSVKMLIGESNALAIHDVASTKRQLPVLKQEQLNTYSVDYDYNKSLIFYAAEDKIFRATMDGKKITAKESIIDYVFQPARLAVDWVNDRIYWMSDKGQTVEVADLDGSNRTLIADNFRPFAYPNNIAVDPYEKVLFFVSDSTVFKSDLDGGNIENIAIEGNERGKVDRGVKSIALDRHNRKLYFTGKGFNSTIYIDHTNYDGSDQGTVPNLDQTQWNDIYGIEVFNNTLFFALFTHNESDSLWRVDLGTTSPIPVKIFVPRRSTDDIWSMRLVHPCIQRPADSKTCPCTQSTAIPSS